MGSGRKKFEWSVKLNLFANVMNITKLQGTELVKLILIARGKKKKKKPLSCFCTFLNLIPCMLYHACCRLTIKNVYEIILQE